MHFLWIRVEGFQLEKLLSLCLKEHIYLKNIRIKNAMEMTFRMNQSDWPHFVRLTKRNYRIEVLEEGGIRPIVKRMIGKKRTLVGVALFVILLLYQNAFISEIRIYGYEAITESLIRKELADVGLYEGCSKTVDLDQVEIELFKRFEDISWVGIQLNGNLALVQIVENEPIPEKTSEHGYSNIVAIKEGYIESVVAREGKVSTQKGDFVKVGDVLITGILPIEDKTYQRDPDQPSYRYVRANGEVYAKTVYRFVRYQEKEELKKHKTGRHVYGLILSVGHLNWNTEKILWPYDQAIYEETMVCNLIRPIPLKIGITRQWEVDLERVPRTKEAMEHEGNQQTRAVINETIDGSASILKKSLKFEEEENIIKVIIMVEALEQIGKEEALLPQKNEINMEDAKEGIKTVGEFTN